MKAPHESLKDEFVHIIPRLRAFAISLCGNSDRADDLVQETLVKAWAKRDSFIEGTNLAAWLFTILRNAFYSPLRKQKHEVEDADSERALRLASPPAQGGHMNLQDFRAALMTLPATQREALILIGGSGLSYEEAAVTCACPVGTVKSRVNRARNHLAKQLAVDFVDDFGPDAIVQATLV